MIDGKRVLGLIPARGGSKGVKRKNIRNVAGRPLIAWTIEAALASSTIDGIVLTSDDPEIIATAREYGCPDHIVRPAQLANDEAKAIDMAHHAMGELAARGETYDIFVLLQPTSRFRTAEDIDACVSLVAGGKPYVVSVTEATTSPYWMYRINDDGYMKRLLPPPEIDWRRQDLPSVYATNGAVYAAKWDWLKAANSFISEEAFAYPMTAERSIDIDGELELEIADLLMRRRLNAKNQ